MAEEEEVEKYRRLYEEQKAKVKELERQNSQLKVRTDGVVRGELPSLCVAAQRSPVRAIRSRVI